MPIQEHRVLEGEIIILFVNMNAYKMKIPFVVLGLAKDSTPELVRSTLARLMERYTASFGARSRISTKYD